MDLVILFVAFAAMFWGPMVVYELLKRHGLRVLTNLLHFTGEALVRFFEDEYDRPPGSWMPYGRDLDHPSYNMSNETQPRQDQQRPPR